MIMIKRIILLVLLAWNMLLTAQVTIQMERDGGVYKIPCTVNGVKMKFIFDTGASTVCMSQTMAQFLLDGEYISYADFKGTGQSVVADGSIVNHSVLVLRDVEIAGLHLHDVDAIILDSQSAPLLLGQSAISELGRITIEGDRLIIHRAENEMTNEQMQHLFRQAGLYEATNSYLAAAECLEKVDVARGLSEDHLWELCYCYKMGDQYVKCIQACNRWIAEYEDYNDLGEKALIYSYLACSYYFTGNIDKALLWYQKELVLQVLQDNKSGIAYNKRSQAWCYDDLGRYNEALQLYNEYMKYILDAEYQKRNCTSQEFAKLSVEGKIHDESLGFCFYEVANIYYKLKDYKNGDSLMITAGKMGCVEARNYCDVHIRPYVPEYQTNTWNW